RDATHDRRDVCPEAIRYRDAAGSGGGKARQGLTCPGGSAKPSMVQMYVSATGVPAALLACLRIQMHIAGAGTFVSTEYGSMTKPAWTMLPVRVLFLPFAAAPLRRTGTSLRSGWIGLLARHGRTSRSGYGPVRVLGIWPTPPSGFGPYMSSSSFSTSSR